MDLFVDLKDRLKEFTDIVYIDYERETILLEVHKNYLDEIIRLIKINPYVDFDVVFQKEIKKNIYTIAVCVPQIIDVFEEDDNQ